MQHPNNETSLCALCEEKPATEQYTRAGHTETLCAACFERWTLQDALEGKLVHILGLARRRQYDEALACLDAILGANQERDHDGWLAQSVAHERAVILFEAGRYVDAEQAYHAWAELGFIDVWRRRMHALGLAKTLEALGRDREALAVLEDVLGYDDPRDLPFALTVLAELVRFSDKLGLSVDAKWLKLAEAAAERYGVEMPPGDSPGKAILALREITRSMQPKRPN